jgi:glycosyltransferase involved in cell wall biosynthesis
MNLSGPLVSVVIPTKNRPQLVVRAVQSVLAQTLEAIETIVVIDGPDKTTEQNLRQLDDPRVRMILSPISLGAGSARNAGVHQARADWVAFLDDDDEWLPQKLEVQFQAAQESTHPYPVIACRVIARSENVDLVWPYRLPKPGEILSEYLFCQSSLFGGEGLVIPSMILTKKELLERVPFTSGLQRHQDIDWLLRASGMKGVHVEFVSTLAPLAVWNIEENRRRLSNTADWSWSLSWGQANRSLFTPRAYASFVLTWVSLTAARERNWKAFYLLISEAHRRGKLSLNDLLAHLIIWLIPQKVRRRLTPLFRKRDQGRNRTSLNCQRKGDE